MQLVEDFYPLKNDDHFLWTIVKLHTFSLNDQYPLNTLHFSLTLVNINVLK